MVNMKIRKAILTGGGRATRLYPITTTINKHLLPLANKPMIFHAIEKAVEAGIQEIFININPGDKELEQYVGDGGHWGINIKFFEQTGGPQGIAHVAKEAEKFIRNDPFMFYLSDNVLLGGLMDLFVEFSQGKHDCVLALSQVEDARQFGVPIFDATKRLVDVWEKPTNPPNNLAVTGIYLYGPKVFFQAFDHIERSARGEYEISSIHSHFLKNNFKVGYKEITGWWKDTGQPKDLLIASALLLDQMEARQFPNHGSIDPSAKISGKVQIGIGTRVGANVVIEGPVIIAENCLLENCQLGPYVTIGAGAEIRQAKIKNSIILNNGLIDADVFISDSMLGRSIKLTKMSGISQRMIIGDKTVIEI